MNFIYHAKKVISFLNPRPTSPGLLGWVAGLAFLMWSLPAARAAFHLWAVTEIYSSADGSVQFVRLTNNSTFTVENSVAGHPITCSGPLGTHSFTIPANLVGSTLNKNFLIGTSNLTRVPGGVTPDFVFTNTVPFLFINAGGTATVGITSSSEAAASYSVLPTDGVSSLAGLGSLVPATNAPRNFADQTNSIVPVQFRSAQLLDTNFIMTFNTARGVNGSAGPVYAVEFKDSLPGTNWSLLTSVPGNGTAKSVSNATASAAQRFFRLNVP